LRRQNLSSVFCLLLRKHSNARSETRGFNRKMRRKGERNIINELFTAS
jgi:hypothetical protein